MTASPLATALRRERIAVQAALAAVVAAGWVYLLLGAGVETDKMDMGGGGIMVVRPEWTPGYAALTLLMWAAMMAAMMLPGAAPAIVEVASLARRPGKSVAMALMFVTGYLTPWAGFSIAATILQWALDSGNLLSETMAIRSAALAGILIVAVGLYQLASWKQHCLWHCRSFAKCLAPDSLAPDGLAPDQRQSAWAPIRQGMRYGVSCLGCCSALMGLMFVGGPMNALWMAAIALLVIAEKSLRRGSGIARLVGAGLVAWGSVSLAAAGL
jgi:predicted metal-binding membrane protein